MIEAVEQAFGIILSEGGLGAMVVILMAVIVFLYRENRQINKEYLEYAKESSKVLNEPLQKLQSTSDKIAERLEGMNQLLIKLIK